MYKILQMKCIHILDKYNSNCKYLIYIQFIAILTLDYILLKSFPELSFTLQYVSI